VACHADAQRFRRRLRVFLPVVLPCEGTWALYSSESSNSMSSTLI